MVPETLFSLSVTGLPAGVGVDIPTGKPSSASPEVAEAVPAASPAGTPRDTHQQAPRVQAFMVTVKDVTTDVVLDTTNYTWNSMVNILQNVDTLNKDRYDCWMHETYFSDLIGDYDIATTLQLLTDGKVVEKWDISFPIVDCFAEILAHPVFGIGTNGELDQDEFEEPDVLDNTQADNVKELLQKIARLSQVRVGYRLDTAVTRIENHGNGPRYRGSHV